MREHGGKIRSFSKLLIKDILERHVFVVKRKITGDYRSLALRGIRELWHMHKQYDFKIKKRNRKPFETLLKMFMVYDNDDKAVMIRHKLN